MLKTCNYVVGGFFVIEEVGIQNTVVCFTFTFHLI